MPRPKQKDCKPKPPSARSKKLIAQGRRYYVPAYKPREMILERGKGARLWDIDGNDYIDLGAGIAVTALGHRNDELLKTITAQAKKLWHTSNIFFSEPPIQLAKELVEASPFAERVFFTNSGAEANEAAIKLARKYASTKHTDNPAKREIVTFTGSFHGRTLATVTATAQPKYQQGYEPLPGGFVYAPFNDVAAAEKLIGADTCAVLVEPVQGEGGITAARPGFLLHLQKLCRKYDALLMFDEVQCGMGRTGKLYAYQHEAGVAPDVVTIAKAFGGGLPIGAMLAGKKAAEIFQFGSHGSTFGGNPIACAVARVVLRKVRSAALMKNVEKQGKKLRDTLEALGKKYDLFQEVRGRGLMVGAELKGPWRGKAGEISECARAHGLLVLQAGPDVMRFLPPLNITDAEMKEGLKRLAEALASFVVQQKTAA